MLSEYDDFINRTFSFKTSKPMINRDPMVALFLEYFNRPRLGGQKELYDSIVNGSTRDIFDQSLRRKPTGTHGHRFNLISF